MADLRSSVLEAARQRLGHGPCADPLVHDVLVSTHDLRVDDRWPVLAEALSDTAGSERGAGRPGVRSPDRGPHRRPLLARDRDALTTQRQEALEHSVVMRRAVGLLTGARRMDAVTTFDILRRQARADRRKVADPATDTLEALR